MSRSACAATSTRWTPTTREMLQPVAPTVNVSALQSRSTTPWDVVSRQSTSAASLALASTDESTAPPRASCTEAVGVSLPAASRTSSRKPTMQFFPFPFAS